MYSPSNNIEIMLSNEADKIIEALFDSFLQRYQKGLEESMRGCEFVFDSVNSLYCKLHKISLNGCGSYTDSPKWLKKAGGHTTWPQIRQKALKMSVCPPNISASTR